jgi:hypothetical protein
VRNLRNWLLAGVFTFVVAGSAAVAPANPWFQAVFTGVVTAIAIAVSCPPGAMHLRWRIAASLAASFASLALYVAHASIERACTARDASGRIVVIGTELTPEGKRYLEVNPHDNPDAILQALGGLGPERAWTAASIARCRLELHGTESLWMPLLGVALVCAVSFMQSSRVGTSAANAGGPKNVFISYNHEDAAVARRLRDALRAAGLRVAMDIDSMAPGERIQDFIERSITDSYAVISIVSTKSLLSSWVATETVSAFHRQKWADGKLFVGALLSDDFLRPEFRLECTRTIDERLQAIERLLPEYREKMIDPVDLNDEKTRLYDLRNNLGGILANLKGSLCLDLRDEHFAGSCQAIVKACRQG